MLSSQFRKRLNDDLDDNLILTGRDLISTAYDDWVEYCSDKSFDEFFPEMRNIKRDKTYKVSNDLEDIEEIVIPKEGKRYSIQIIKYVSDTFLISIPETNVYFFGSLKGIEGYQGSYTVYEIDELKQRKDVAIDWNKVVFKEEKNEN